MRMTSASGELTSIRCSIPTRPLRPGLKGSSHTVRRPFRQSSITRTSVTGFHERAFHHTGPSCRERPALSSVRNDAPRQRVGVDEDLLHAVLDLDSSPSAWELGVGSLELRQCLKCRRPVNTIASPCSSAAAMTSLSLTDPPVCTTAVAPAAAIASSPSRNGMNASDAATDPTSRSGRIAAAFIRATLTESTRLICPAPIARVRSALVKITVFDLTCAQSRHANRIACHSSAVGCRFVTT